jgi:hypothetical protein
MKNIENMRAPVRFGRVSYICSNGNDYTEILHKIPKHAFLISFIPPPPDGLASYKQIKEFCTKNGVRTQAVKLQYVLSLSLPLSIQHTLNTHTHIHRLSLSL